MRFVVLSIVFATAYFAVCNARIVDPGELDRALLAYGAKENELHTWHCIVEHESRYDTAARNWESGDHGIFQISQIFWCSPPGTGCGMTCDSLRDDNINNDAQCAMLIFNDWQTRTGNGFGPWTTYWQYCQ